MPKQLTTLQHPTFADMKVEVEKDTAADWRDQGWLGENTKAAKELTADAE